MILHKKWGKTSPEAVHLCAVCECDMIWAVVQYKRVVLFFVLFLVSLASQVLNVLFFKNSWFWFLGKVHVAIAKDACFMRA